MAEPITLTQLSISSPEEETEERHPLKQTRTEKDCGKRLWKNINGSQA